MAIIYIRSFLDIGRLLYLPGQDIVHVSCENPVTLSPHKETDADAGADAGEGADAGAGAGANAGAGARAGADAGAGRFFCSFCMDPAPSVRYLHEASYTLLI